MGGHFFVPSEPAEEAVTALNRHLEKQAPINDMLA